MEDDDDWVGGEYNQAEGFCDEVLRLDREPGARMDDE